ncbi:nuclear transport factor 2 family protein [Companilactobacillus sp. DQM5]|uniref:nuclear transport factor 2 family protein n=1 Tax=Companilactobacillus sp. DQM5 TaxID=3463359 RepID=UPI004058D617
MNELYEKLLHETYILTGQGKLDEFKSYLADDVSWTEAKGFPYAGTYVGPDEVIKNVHQRLGTEWNNYSAKDISYGFNGNKVYVYGQYSGEYKETKKSFIADFVHIYEFNNDKKVQKFTQVVDSHTVVQAMKN